MDSKDGVSAPVKEWKLQKQEELRVEAKGKITIRMTRGTAEVFGMELPEGKEQSFEKCKFAVFTWGGCDITVTGACEVCYKSEETPMVSYINTHAALQKLREHAQALGERGRGPVVMVVGPKDSGKSTLCRMLLSYAVRVGWKPTFVDLDVGQNSISGPGAIAASPVEEPVGILSEWKNRAPIAYFYGHTAASQHVAIYKKLCERLAAAVKERCDAIPIARHSGVVINTCGWVDAGGRDLIVDLAKSFKVNVILVVGQEKLYNELQTSADIKELGTTVIKLNKSPGVVSRLPAARRDVRNTMFREYFYGTAGDLCPHEVKVPFHEIMIYRVGGTLRAPTSALPIGQKSLLDPNRCVKVDITSDLKHCVLGVSHATKADELLTTNVAGFVLVKDVDVQGQRLTVLAPAAGKLPFRFLLFGSTKWFDA